MVVHVKCDVSAKCSCTCSHDHKAEEKFCVPCHKPFPCWVQVIHAFEHPTTAHSVNFRTVGRICMLGFCITPEICMVIMFHLFWPVKFPGLEITNRINHFDGCAHRYSWCISQGLINKLQLYSSRHWWWSIAVFSHTSLLVRLVSVLGCPHCTVHFWLLHIFLHLQWSLSLASCTVLFISVLLSVAAESHWKLVVLSFKLLSLIFLVIIPTEDSSKGFFFQKCCFFFRKCN